MKRFSTITILSMLAAVFLAACSNRKSNREQEPAGKEEQMVMTADTVIPAAGILLKDDRLNAVYMQYAELTRALINDDVKTARLSANAVAAGAAEMTGAAAVAAAAAKITATADIEAQRTAYAALSNEIISLIKKSGMNRGLCTSTSARWR
ncbi:MAG TPA: DUF3347 domain-containing protein [Chitinophaga sp.]|uniref:DUF3347 domain-containing protein n=1 Tax=Chitinophaga sp. TaxID=1869181 RepID=UPI002BE6E847|nr:DUF3347 domain-containing protein [Chitinophaga sp.]HVI48755.1 DUF3347 domain-containing protein [Chitinophaga sp.]